MEVGAVEQVLAEWAKAQRYRDYRLADRLRQRLFVQGIEFEEQPEGISWTVTG